MPQPDENKSVKLIGDKALIKRFFEKDSSLEQSGWTRLYELENAQPDLFERIVFTSDRSRDCHCAIWITEDTDGYEICSYKTGGDSPSDEFDSLMLETFCLELGRLAQGVDGVKLVTQSKQRFSDIFGAFACVLLEDFAKESVYTASNALWLSAICSVHIAKHTNPPAFTDVVELLASSGMPVEMSLAWAERWKEDWTLLDRHKTMLDAEVHRNRLEPRALLAASTDSSSRSEQGS